jgi:hypothetical protein
MESLFHLSHENIERAFLYSTFQQKKRSQNDGMRLMRICWVFIIYTVFSLCALLRRGGVVGEGTIITIQ